MYICKKNVFPKTGATELELALQTHLFGMAFIPFRKRARQVSLIAGFPSHPLVLRNIRLNILSSF